jgi:hypothetical protein
MIIEFQKWFQNIMRGHSFNNVMNAFTELLAKSKGKEFFAELTVKLAKSGSGSEEVGKITEKIYLQVENMAGASKAVFEHAANKGVTIIDDISQIIF